MKPILRAVRYILQGGILWKYIVEGTSNTDIVNFGIYPFVLSESSTKEDFAAAKARAG